MQHDSYFGMENGLQGKRMETEKLSGGCCIYEPKPEPRVAWVKAVEREVDAFQRYLESRNNRTW